MAFGIQIKHIELNKEYTYDTLFEAMKQKTDWTAGEVQLVKHGFADVIVFPPIDRQNQVWVQLMSTKPCKKVQVYSSHEIAGDFGNMAKNALLDAVTDGWSSMGSMFGKKAKQNEEFVKATIKEIQDLGL